MLTNVHSTYCWDSSSAHSMSQIQSPSQNHWHPLSCRHSLLSPRRKESRLFAVQFLGRKAGNQEAIQVYDKAPKGFKVSLKRLSKAKIGHSEHKYDLNKRQCLNSNISPLCGGLNVKCPHGLMCWWLRLILNPCLVGPLGRGALLEEGCPGGRHRIW